MSADLMLVCQERGEYYDTDSKACVFVDETSAGEPWYEFGRLIAGYEGKNIDMDFIRRVQTWLSWLTVHPNADREKIMTWLEKHAGLRLELDAW